jgi:hypothetical protein
VVDRSGASVPNAQVSLYLTGGDTAVFKVKSGAEGRFDFAGVRPEYYRLKVEATGFMTVAGRYQGRSRTRDLAAAAGSRSRRRDSSG